MPHQSHGGRPSGYVYPSTVPINGIFLADRTGRMRWVLAVCHVPYEATRLKEVDDEVASQPMRHPLRNIPTSIVKLTMGETDVTLQRYR